MKVWAHTVFQNEERWLWFAVTSVIDYVDKVLLWDTGSTDTSWEVAKLLKEKYKDKIDLRQYGKVTPEEFTKVRQKMLDATKADWFIVVDADEIWWDDSIKKVVDTIKSSSNEVESIVVKNFNLVGDVYHNFDNSAGKYKFGKLIGNYALRAIKTSIPGLTSQGRHGIWGWSDGEKHVQDRNTFEVIDTAYIHTTFLPRGESRMDDIKVPKRAKKLKYEIGIEFPSDFYYPEAFFNEKPDFIPSPWKTMGMGYRLKSMVLTPFKKIRRLFKNEKVGY